MSQTVGVPSEPLQRVWGEDSLGASFWRDCYSWTACDSILLCFHLRSITAIPGNVPPHPSAAGRRFVSGLSRCGQCKTTSAVPDDSDGSWGWKRTGPVVHPIGGTITEGHRHYNSEPNPAVLPVQARGQSRPRISDPIVCCKPGYHYALSTRGIYYLDGLWKLFYKVRGVCIHGSTTGGLLYRRSRYPFVSPTRPNVGLSPQVRRGR